MAGDPFTQVDFDVAVFRPVAIPAGPPLKIEFVETDDSNLGWDGRPIRRCRKSGSKGGRPTRSTRLAGGERRSTRAKDKGRSNRRSDRAAEGGA
jgi:hypothetical protein